VINRPAEQRRRGVDHALAARGQAIDAVAGTVPQRDARRAAFAVAPIEDAGAHRRVLLHRVGQELHFIRREQAAGVGEAFVIELGRLRAFSMLGMVRFLNFRT